MREIIVVAMLAVLASCHPVHAGPLDETRYCGVVRDADGSISRSATVVAKFKRLHPCPSTMQTSGACPGWQADHVIPLACGGCDAVSNIQWLPVEIKACAGDRCKDRWERKIYCRASVVL